jgi:hypothetical protein
VRDEGPGKLRSPRKCLDLEEQEELVELDSSGDEVEGEARIEFVPVISYISPSLGRLVSPLKVHPPVYLLDPAPSSWPTSCPCPCRC